MKRHLIAALVGLMGIQLLAVLTAGSIPKGPKFSVHVQPHASGRGVSTCGVSPIETLTPCSSYTTQGALQTGYDLYVIIGQADSLGIGGATFGIDYNGTRGEGIDFSSPWILCSSGLEFPSVGWPGAGSGNVITWNPTTGCGNTFVPPDEVHATAGAIYVYAYSPDRFSIIRHMQLQSGPSLKTANCQAAETEVILEEVPLKAGYVDFGGGQGFNPCGGVIPTEPTSWGQMKTKY